MSETPENPEQSRDEPDYFSYYVQAIAELMSENEDKLPTSTITELNLGKYGNVKMKETADDSCMAAGSPFDNCIEAGMSDYKKGRLHKLLRQSVHDLTTEVDEMLDPVLRLSELRCRLKRTGSTSNSIGVGTNVDVNNGPQSRLSFSASSPASWLVDSGPQVDDDWQVLQQTDSRLVEETIKKYSDELSATLKHMEQKLEALLDSVVLKCRPMTLAEKQRLLKLIKKSSQENLSRVAEIIQRSRTGKNFAKDIFVDLEEEENPMLWRVYFYVQAVENAKKLAT